MVKFRTFGLGEQHWVTETWTGFFGGKTEHRVQRPLYQNMHELYAAAAAFATEVGDRLVAITSTRWPETSMCFRGGEVVVWYREVA